MKASEKVTIRSSHSKQLETTAAVLSLINTHLYIQARGLASFRLYVGYAVASDLLKQHQLSSPR